MNESGDIFNLSSLITSENAHNLNSKFLLSEFENSTNAASKQKIKPYFDGLTLMMLITIMLSVGCELTFKSLWIHLKRPVGLIIGLFSQFLFLPLCAFCLLLIVGITGLQATGILIISCCPGGVLSNTFTYFCDGDLSLSVAMTCMSTVLALGLMPANIWLYGRYFESSDLVIPYKKMSISMAIVTSPAFVGILIKWWFPKVSSCIAKYGIILGVLMVLALLIFEVIIFPEMFSSMPSQVYGVILCLPFMALGLGYGLAFVLRQPLPVRKTIAIECGVQNASLALTIMAFSFPLEVQEEIVLLPWIYASSLVIACISYYLWYNYTKKKEHRAVPVSEVPM